MSNLVSAVNSLGQAQNSIPDLTIPLSNLSTIPATMDSVRNFLSQSINANTVVDKCQMEIVSSEISAAIHQILVNGVNILENLQSSQLKSPTMEEPSDHNSTRTNKPLHSIPDPEVWIRQPEDPKTEQGELADVGEDGGIMEIDAMELLAEHKHFCDVCGKGFKRDANLRMHMRAHGSQFKTPQALMKPETIADRSRFSCPHDGCSRNRKHSKFRALKSVICLKNHFKRSHCPKVYRCNRCNKKSFSVMADLKSHLKHCGEIKWKCSCGTTFSRKDKLFGHMTLFEGHMPAVADEDAKLEGVVVPTENQEQERGMNCSDNELFDGLLDGIGSLEGYSLQDMFGC